jgi:hypothetical protein
LKVLFLDVDGVLVHSGTTNGGRLIGEPWGSSFYFAATIDPACASRVKQIVDRTGVKLVVSSVWRTHAAQMTGLKRALIQAGFERRQLREVVIGATAVMEQNKPKEILAWLEEYKRLGIERYSALDDSYLEGVNQVNPLPNWHTGGLQDETVERLVEYFKD